MIERRACKRCGWVRTSNSRTPDICTSCKGCQRESVDPGTDRIEWQKVGLIHRGTVHPTPKTKGT